MFDSTMCQFMATDAIDHPGMSPYAYANNTPLNLIDPDGKEADFPISVSRPDSSVSSVGLRLDSLSVVQFMDKAFQPTPEDVEASQNGSDMRAHVAVGAASIGAGRLVNQLALGLADANPFDNMLRYGWEYVHNVLTHDMSPNYLLAHHQMRYGNFVQRVLRGPWFFTNYALYSSFHYFSGGRGRFFWRLAHQLWGRKLLVHPSNVGANGVYNAVKAYGTVYQTAATTRAIGIGLQGFGWATFVIGFEGCSPAQCNPNRKPLVEVTLKKVDFDMPLSPLPGAVPRIRFRYPSLSVEFNP